ncbi:MAG: 3-dehydro-bile acid delta(4,6)-reductase [Chlamydiales bacterium]|nr:3-dehydro-bile acid delta(4,6)-reductase [Chlamydiales bacterium]
MEKCVIIGAGAAGCFAAIACAEAHPRAEVVILEKTRQPLAKVRVSGGGRCNVTHACFDPKVLVESYPRGSKELLGPFHRFQPADTVAWFQERGIELKTEKDGRMFPSTDRSETIIDCFLNEIKKRNIELQLGVKIEQIPEDADAVILATGSSRHGHKMAQLAGHTLIDPVPSLFSFNVPSSPLLGLSGVSVPEATVWLEGRSCRQTGPLLITHWGFSGPAVLKLSAWEARFLHECAYQATCLIEWKEPLPKRLYRALKEHPNHHYRIEGKTTYKSEFVTCGGVSLKEVNFKTMESRIRPGLFFAGEVLDIDGVTGGYNFQNAWTTGWIAGHSI